MSSIAAHSPTFERGFHSPREAAHPAHYWPTSRLYNVENCVNCGHTYEFKKSKYDSNGDATMPWKHFSAIVADHYHSCPKKLANIHRPTSAIRGTLTSPTEKKQRGVERMRSPPFYSPYPRNPSRRMGVDSPPLHGPRPASPEPSPAAAPHNSTQRIESSTLAALPQRNSPSPHSTHRIPDGPHKSPKNRPTIGLSQSPPRSWRRSSPPPPLRVVTNDESITAPLSPPIVLPPLWNRKRKRAQFQESGETDPHPPLKKILVALDPPAGTARNVQPQSRTPSPIERPDIARVITAAPGRDLPELYMDYGDPEEERPGKKAKKNVMSWEERRDTMECDPLLGIVEAKRVYCKPCKKWIKLDARNDFYPGLWVKHRKTMHGFSGMEGSYFAPERRRRSGSGGVGGGAGNGGGASSRPKKTAGNTSRRQDQDEAQESYQRNVAAATSRVRSSSRITRSSSSTSV